MQNRRRSPRHLAVIHAVQMLEPRQLLSASVIHNSAVIMNTSLGEVAIELDSTTPITNANFLSYVTAGSYNNSVFHRIAVNGQTQFQGTTETYSIVQGGGYTDNQGTLTPITPNAPITNEYSSSNPDAIGTIAMARMSGLDSATSEFFFNVSDNSSVFPNYAVFGNVIRGLGIVDTIDGLTPSNSVTNQTNIPETNTGAFVTINTATEEDTMTVTIGKNDAAGDHTVTFKDPSAGGGSTTIALSNANATLTFTGTNLNARHNGGNLVVTGTNLELQEVASTNSTAQSNLTFSPSGRVQHINVGDINITGSINSITGNSVNLTGDIAVTGGIKTVKLLETTTAGFISLDSTQFAKAPATTINIPFISDISIQTGGPVKELITRQYIVNDGTSREVSASGDITKVMVFGEMDASVGGNSVGNFRAAEMSGFIAGNTIGSVTADVFQQGYIYAAGPYNAKTLGIGKVNILGSINGAQILSAGNIGTIKAGSMTSTDIYAGIDTSDLSQTGGFPAALASNATLKSVSLKTPKGKATSFSDSQIGAFEIDSLHLGRVSTTVASGSSLTTMGIMTNNLKVLTATTDQKQSLALSNVTSQTALNTTINKRGLKLNPGAAFGSVTTGTTTTSGFTSGYSYSAITLSNALVTAIPAGTVVTIVSGSNTQTATLSAAAAVGATSLTVTPFTANANYAAGTTVQGTQASFTTLTSGSTYSSITLNGALATTIPSGTVVTLDDGAGNTQAVTLSADADAGTTLLTVTPFTANAAYTTTATVDGTQVFATTSGLTLGASYGTLTLSTALTTPLAAGTTLTIASGTSTQSVVLGANAAAGATSLTVTTFTANAAYASGSSITDSNEDSIPTLSGGTETTSSTGTFASAVGGDTLASSITATTTGLISGVAYTSVTLNAPLTAALPSNETLLLTSGNNSQIVSLGAAGSVGDTSLTTTSFTANTNYPAGSALTVAGFVFDIL